MKVIYDIHISFVHPPIPDRNYDYEAIRSGYDEGDPIGRGPDLLDHEMEKEAPDFNQESNLHADTVAERYDAARER